MVYALLVINILLYSYNSDLKLKERNFLNYFLPIALILILVLSLQREVGTDYLSYLELADGTRSVDYIKNRGEYFFIALIYLVRLFKSPQLIFFFSAIIQTFFLGLTVYEIKKSDFKLYNFFFLYFSLSLIFFNQFNGIRQYISVYIIIYAFFKLKEDKVISFLFLIVIASLFHLSSIFFIVFPLIKNLLKKEIPFRRVIILILILFFISFLNLDFIWTKLLSYTSYSNYTVSEYFKRTPIRGIVTKIPKIIIVLVSSFIIEKEKIITNYKDRFLVNMSYISLIVMILSFTSSIIWRFYQFFDFFIIFPVLILLDKSANKNIKILISLMLISLLIVKIIVFPQGEYLYNSILLY